MSEDNSTPTGRTRRRASRQAGPPVDEPNAGTVSDTTVKLGANGTEQASGESASTPVVAETTAAAAETTADAHPTAGEAETTGAKVEATAADAKTASAGRRVGAFAAAAAKLGAIGSTGSQDATTKLATDATAASGAEAAAVPDADATVKLATATPAAPGSANAGAGSAPKRALGWLGWAAAVVAILSLVLLVGSGGFFAYHEHQVDARADQRSEYVQTAKQAILNLTNIKDDTAKQDIDRVLSVASGQLKQEYSERKDAYAQVVQQAKVKASGEIIETAVESQDDHTAKVLVAAKQTLTNAGSKDPQERYYRFRVTVDRDDNGGITASQVEFVA